MAIIIKVFRGFLFGLKEIILIFLHFKLLLHMIESEVYIFKFKF